jgi:hypothetical protein
MCISSLPRPECGVPPFAVLRRPSARENRPELLDLLIRNAYHPSEDEMQFGTLFPVVPAD